MTYGWALLVIVIVAALLWYFGVFNPSKWTAERQCGGFTSFSCNSFKLNSQADGTLAANTFSSIVLGNKWGQRVTSVRLAGILDSGGNFLGGGLNVSNSLVELNSGTMGTCTNNMSATNTDVAWNPNSFSAETDHQVVCHFFTNLTGAFGDSSDQLRVILYYNDSTGTTHTDSGFVKGKWE